ncbi:MAG TPA: cupin domain-containing protein [Terriglobales bacterium]|nr:cupin domain-containing protein [Terriglobales bacterium]
MAALSIAAMLSLWFSQCSRESFFRDYFQREPLAQTGTAVTAVSLLTWGMVRRLCHAGADLLLVHAGQLRQEPAPASFAELEELFRQGWSLVLRACERQDTGLAMLTRAFAAEIEGDVSIQIYATPAKAQGFGWHYDFEDVFIAQSTGSKTYFLRRNTINPEPTRDAMPREMGYERETGPIFSSTLQAGDALYIPRGWWHAARADETSLSMSVGVASPAAWGKSSAVDPAVGSVASVRPCRCTPS